MCLSPDSLCRCWGWTVVLRFAVKNNLGFWGHLGSLNRWLAVFIRIVFLLVHVLLLAVLVTILLVIINIIVNFCTFFHFFHYFGIVSICPVIIISPLVSKTSSSPSIVSSSS